MATGSAATVDGGHCWSFVSEVISLLRPHLTTGFFSVLPLFLFWLVCYCADRSPVLSILSPFLRVLIFLAFSVGSVSVCFLFGFLSVPDVFFCLFMCRVPKKDMLFKI